MEDLEIIILSEVKWVRERQILCDIAYMWNIKKNTNDLIYKTEIDPTENRKQTYDYQTANLSLPHTPLPLGNHKFVFSICESVSVS